MTNPPTEPVWTYRGYQLRPSEFTTAMVHLFRAEISRANVWRQRLDATTNWAVVATAAVISFAFSEPFAFSSMILLNMLLVTMFLSIEARRYRYYELWSERIRLMETDFYAAMLVPPFRPDPDWAESLAESLLQPSFPISSLEAFGRRLRRNYIWIYLILGLAWFIKLGIHPTPATTFREFINRASLGPIPGNIVILLGLLFNLSLLLVALLTMGLHEASGEVLPRYTVTEEPHLTGETRETGWWDKTAWFRHTHRRRQLMALIITDREQIVSKQILENMQRGVTSLQGKGMYTGEAHSVLMVALTVTEVNQLKTLVIQEDPNAFVVVSPAQEVFGRGFSSLEPK